MPRSRSRLMLTIALALLAGLPASAADTKPATVVGHVLDSEDEPLSGVGVTITGEAYEHEATTDRKGRFKATVPDAAAGYEIRIEREGYPPFTDALTFPAAGSYRMEWRMNATPLGSPTGSMEALKLYNAGADAYNADDLDLALEKFEAAVAVDPEFGKAHAVIAEIHHQRSRHEQALEAAARVLALEPDHVPALRVSYLSAEALGREDAEGFLDRLAARDRSPQTAVLLYNDGVTARVAGDRERALKRYTVAVEIDPTLTSALSALAGLQLEIEDYEGALESSRRVLDIDPEDARGHSVRYNTLIAMGRDDEAAAALAELRRVAPAAVAEAFFERGAMLFDEGFVKEAVPALEQSLAADPELAKGHYTIGLCYMNLGRNDDARRHLERFLELAPDDPDAEPARQLIAVLARTD